MFTDGQTVIGGEDDVGVSGLARLTESFENSADLDIHIGDMSVVFGAMKAHGFSGSGEGSKEFVANLVVALIKRMLGRVVGWNGDTILRVAFDKFARGLARVMRGVESDVEKKGIVALGGEADLSGGGIGPNGGGVADFVRAGIGAGVMPLFRMKPLTFARSVPRSPGGTCCRAMVSVGPRFEHAG